MRGRQFVSPLWKESFLPISFRSGLVSIHLISNISKWAGPRYTTNVIVRLILYVFMNQLAVSRLGIYLLIDNDGFTCLVIIVMDGATK